MQYWLMKTEPSTFSFDDLVRLNEDHWDGVRNYQARNNMKAMKKGDQVLIYHSVTEKQVVGIAEVSKEYYQDPTTDDDRWVVVNITPVRKLRRPVTLAEIKADVSLGSMALVKHSRLSVSPVAKEDFERVVQRSELQL